MDKVGILTFHYSNNYGGVLQCLALQNVLKKQGYNVEVINFIPSSYKPRNILNSLGVKKNIFANKKEDLNILELTKKLIIKKQNNSRIMDKFDTFRESNFNLGKEVDERTIESILHEYSAIIVGSDQIWNPSQRSKREYFLDFGDKFNGKKISYAADSTIKEIDNSHRVKLAKNLNEFHSISVRNEHSYEFVKSLTNKEVPIVADPTVLHDFNIDNVKNVETSEYILAYILGEEINGSHKEAVRKIKKAYGNIPVFAIVIPTMNFRFFDCADKVFYDLGPTDWLMMFKNAKFIYTDSFHGVLFSLKYHKPFLAYYKEEIRSTRFIDLGKRYKVEKYIVESTEGINRKGSLEAEPDFDAIDRLLTEHKTISIDYIKKSLSEKK